MKPIRFVAFLIYRYYSGGTRPDSSPYFRTMCSMTFLALLHLMQFLALVNRMDLLYTDWKIPRQLIILLIMVPIFLLLTLFVRKKELERMKDEYAYSCDKVFNWNVWLIVYIILSIATLVGLLIWRK